MFPFFQHGVLSKEFVELMGHCNTIQAQYRDRNVERIQRQLKISEYKKPDCDLSVCVLGGLWFSSVVQSLPPSLLALCAGLKFCVIAGLSYDIGHMSSPFSVTFYYTHLTFKSPYLAFISKGWINSPFGGSRFSNVFVFHYMNVFCFGLCVGQNKIFNDVILFLSGIVFLYVFWCSTDQTD